MTDTTPQPGADQHTDIEAPTHFVEVNLEDWHPGDCPTLICKAPADALCHAVWTCDCESWHSQGVEDGAPWHSTGDYSERLDERHVGTFDPEFCNLKEWAANSDECLRGKVTVPVVPEWDFDFVTFHAAPLAERGLAVVPSGEVERLRQWKAEALPVLDGLQEVGRALGTPLGQRITGRESVDLALDLRNRAEGADRVHALVDSTTALHSEMPEPHGAFTRGYEAAMRDVRRILTPTSDARQVSGTTEGSER